MFANSKILKDICALPILSQIDQIGVASIETMETVPNVLNLREILPGARSVIVLSAHIPADVVKQAGKPPAENGMSYSFLQYQIIRETMWAVADLGRWLERKGEHAVPLADLTLKSFPTLAPYGEGRGVGLPDLRANAPFAVAAGLGELGLSGLLLTPEYGPRQRFSFLLTTANLPPTSYRGSTLCTKCKKCAEACPTQALDANVVEEIHIGEKKYIQYVRQEVRCRWARCLGMVPEEGPACLGWKDPGLPIPDELTEEEAEKAIRHKDPLQVIAYNYPFQADIIIERCLQICPAGEMTFRYYEMHEWAE